MSVCEYCGCDIQMYDKAPFGFTGWAIDRSGDPVNDFLCPTPGSFARVPSRGAHEPVEEPEVVWAEYHTFQNENGCDGNPGCDDCGTLDAVVKIDGHFYCQPALTDPEVAAALAAWRSWADPYDDSAFCDECGSTVRAYTGPGYQHDPSCSLYPSQVREDETPVLGPTTAMVVYTVAWSGGYEQPSFFATTDPAAAEKRFAEWCVDAKCCGDCVTTLLAFDPAGGALDTLRHVIAE